jgi:thiol:disulfide interchange protein DsbD
MLGLAFLGGLILNVMPCVLPVIALKILGFVQQSKEEPARVRQMGWMYTLGVVVSFLALAAAVIVVQGGGEDASWGMQMQSPVFRVALLVVVVLVALNLFGVFEIGLSGRAMDGAAKLASRSGFSGAFFNGVLATALATPCTAPFLTAALGFAFLLKSAWVILLVFVFTALGLASPYVVLSWRPDWLRFIPKPGTWMGRFKVAMGFPMLATAIWLFDVAAPPYGEGGVLWLGLFLGVIALAAWVWGEFVQRGARRRGSAVLVCAGLVAGGYFYLLEGQLRWREARLTPTNPEIIRDSPEGLEWHPWSREAVARALAAGQAVLVDFTAKWCLTCKSNKKFALDVEAVRAKLRQMGGIAMRADYTNRDPRITEELKRHGRAAVPTVVIFPAKPGSQPIVLPTVLTPGIVLDALDAASR